MDVYVASPAYVFPCGQEYRETNLSIEFLADNDVEAVKQARDWAFNRLEAVMKAMYPGCFLGSLKVYTKRIGRACADGYIDTYTIWCVFEWKHDWPSTLEQSMESVFARVPLETGHSR
jgi:hypothetical protein